MENHMKRKQGGSEVSVRELSQNQWLTRMACAGTHAKELRRCPRKAITMQVSLNQCMSCFGNGSIRDLCLHGAFVEISHPGLMLGMAVQVGFPFLFAGLPIERRLSARVLRAEPDGVALQFTPYNPEFYSDLFSLLGAELND
jgi:hypothetical protein